MYGSRILLLAPHPDDEVAGCCAAIARARSQGSAVTIGFLTTGVPAQERLWPWDRSSHAWRVERRRAEARSACAKMGAEIAHFSDVSSRELKDHVRETRELVRSQARAHAADMLWAPAYEGGHPDHDIANFIASTLREDL